MLSYDIVTDIKLHNNEQRRPILQQLAFSLLLGWLVFKQPGLVILSECDFH